MRKPYVAGNWKMNKTPAEAAARFIDHLLSPQFGDEAVVDLRTLDVRR